ncbi:hypothetical protein [Phaffia rhodozyma]|uniref:Uncharacterized protein n=1 Tax=Phaffia rhodozyma TaxID=264483 RepID=A0A0F7SKL9_PHARH|nr:hypothetical protein [Phaffia rhodozyma]
MSSSSDDRETLADSPLSTPTLPMFVDSDTEAIINSLTSFSFGGGSAFGSIPGPSSSSSSSSSLSTQRATPVFPPSSFPSYCLPQRTSAQTSTSFTPSWDASDSNDLDGDMVNPSPVYAPLDANGDPINQCPGTPIAEREKFEYPEFTRENSYYSSHSGRDQQGASTSRSLQIPIRPQPVPAPTDRRGSISLPNVMTTSSAVLLPSTSSSSSFSSLSSTGNEEDSSYSAASHPVSPMAPLEYLHPTTSPFATAISTSAVPTFNKSRRQSLPASSPPPYLSRASSFNNHQRTSTAIPESQSPVPPSTSFVLRSNRRGSQTHFHPPLISQRFQPSITSGPIPPSLLNHPALASHSVSSASVSTRDSSTAASHSPITPQAGMFASTSSALRRHPPPSDLAVRRGSLPANTLNFQPSLSAASGSHDRRTSPSSGLRRQSDQTMVSNNSSREPRLRSVSSGTGIGKLSADDRPGRRSSANDAIPPYQSRHGIEGMRPKLGSIRSFGSGEDDTEGEDEHREGKQGLERPTQSAQTIS